jgi:CheY-like chemotaxis protein
MRSFSRVDERVRRAVDVRRVLDSAVEMVGHEIRHRGRLVTDYEEVPPVDVSEAHLEQVFLHLLVHAAQSLPEEARSEVRLEVRLSDDSRVVVSLTVTGRAMDSATLARVFDPFYARDDDRSAVGLPFCRAVVTSLGGEILAESDASTGTTFRVLLPVSTTAHEAPASAKVDSSQLPESRARVLVVDDDPGIGSALRIALEDVHSVTCFTSAVDARDRLLSGEQFDVVFCDVMMPDLDGTKLYQAVLSARPQQAARFVFMTAGAARRGVSEFLARCGRPRLDKPFDTKTVRRVVRIVAG